MMGSDDMVGRVREARLECLRSYTPNILADIDEPAYQLVSFLFRAGSLMTKSCSAYGMYGLCVRAGEQLVRLVGAR